jgi:hypothetical protein
MINTLQLILHLPLLNVSFPANAYYFFKALIDISNFNIIPPKITEVFLSKFNTKDPINGNFNQMDIF